MSTSTSLNYGQSRATPAPSRPTSSHVSTSLMPSAGPTHAAGVNFGNLQLPTLPVPAMQKAIQEYIGKLSDDDKAAFQSAQNIMERLQEIQSNGKPLVSSSLASRVEKVLQCVKTFMSSLAIFIQQSPQISSLVVGGVNFVLTVGTNINTLLFMYT